MTIGTRFAAPLVVLAMAFLVACNGDDSNVTPVTVRPLATMTDEGCTYDGDARPASGVTIDVRNASTDDGTFLIAMMAHGMRRGDLVTWLGKVKRRLPSHRPFEALPPPYGGVNSVYTEVVSGAVSELPTYGLKAGAYAVMCFRGSEWQVLAALDLAAMLELASPVHPATG